MSFLDLLKPLSFEHVKNVVKFNFTNQYSTIVQDNNKFEITYKNGSREVVVYIAMIDSKTAVVDVKDNRCIVKVGRHTFSTVGTFDKHVNKCVEEIYKFI